MHFKHIENLKKKGGGGKECKKNCQTPEDGI